MIDAEQVRQIIAQYERHGWKLRRALFSDEPSPDVLSAVSESAVVNSEIDGLWFSRDSKPGFEAWELRRLSASAFAILTIVKADLEEEELAEALTLVENEMGEKL